MGTPCPTLDLEQASARIIEYRLHSSGDENDDESGFASCENNCDLGPPDWVWSACEDCIECTSEPAKVCCSSEYQDYCDHTCGGACKSGDCPEVCLSYGGPQFAACEGCTCGDEFLDSSEQCDDGNTSNNDACLNTCVNASCGDGFVRSGVEQCDDGNQTDCDASGCQANCTLRPACPTQYACVAESSCGSGEEGCKPHIYTGTPAPQCEDLGYQCCQSLTCSTHQTVKKVTRSCDPCSCCTEQPACVCPNDCEAEEKVELVCGACPTD
jgi:cysteine-rich repeat protein